MYQIESLVQALSLLVYLMLMCSLYHFGPCLLLFRAIQSSSRTFTFLVGHFNYNVLLSSDLDLLQPCRTTSMAECQGVCVVISGTAECRCPSGFDLHNDGVTCVGKPMAYT